MTILCVTLITLLVGFICGCTSVGGVLLIPFLATVLGTPLRVIMGPVLFSFFFSGLVGSAMHLRAGRVDLRSCLPLCLVALLAGYPGAVAKYYVPTAALNAILGLLIVAAGVFSLRQATGGSGAAVAGGRGQKPTLFLIGAFVAFFSGMTGAGGPVLSVPIMLVLGYPPLFCIAAAIPLQVVVTFSGSIGNMVVGDIDYGLGLWISALMMIGVAAGTWSIRFFRPEPLKRVVSLICIGTGLFMLGKSLF